MRTGLPEDLSSISEAYASYKEHPQWYVKFLPAALRKKFLEEVLFKKTVESFFWLAFYNFFLRFVSSFLTSIFIARQLGAENFGTMMYILTYTFLFIPVAQAGLDTIVVRNLTRDSTHKDTILGSTFVLRILFGMLAFCLGTLGIIFLQPGELNLQMMVALLLLGNISFAFEVIEMWYQSRLEAHITAIPRSIVAIIFTGIKLVLVIQQVSLLTLVIVWCIELLISGASLVFAYQKHNDIFAWRVSTQYMKSLTLESLPLLLTTCTVVALARIDQLILHAFQGPFVLAQYALAVNIIDIFAFLPLMLSKAVAPAVVQAHVTSSNSFDLRMKKTYRLMFWLSLLLAVGLIAVAQPLLPRIYGTQYLLASTLLVWLTFRLFIANFGVVRALFVTNEGLFGFEFFTNGVGLVICVALNLVLVPKFGVYGTLWASVISLIVANIVLDVFHPKMRRNALRLFQAIFSRDLFSIHF